MIAAGKRLDALTVELGAARNGTFLGDSYNDASRRRWCRAHGAVRSTTRHGATSSTPGANPEAWDMLIFCCAERSVFGAGQPSMLLVGYCYDRRSER